MLHLTSSARTLATGRQAVSQTGTSQHAIKPALSSRPCVSRRSVARLYQAYASAPSSLVSYLPPIGRIRVACGAQNSRLSTARYFSSRMTPQASARLYEDVNFTAKKITEMWNDWEATEDVFEKREKGKQVIDLYAIFSKQLSALAKDEADFEHNAAISGHPVAQNCYRLGLIHAQRMDNETAIEHLQRSVELDPTNYTCYMKYGEVLHASRMYSSAVQVYTTILTTMSSEFKKSTEKPRQVERPDAYKSNIFNNVKLTPKMVYPHSKLAETLFRRAHAHLMLHSFDEALEDWKSVTALESNQRTAESWAYLAHLSRIHGKWQQTIDLSTRALQFDSELLLAFYERSMAHFVLDNENDVKADNRTFAILAHEKMWGLSNHPTQPDWGPDSGYTGDQTEDM